MKPLYRTLRTGSLVLCCALASACISMEYGSPLITEGLDSLQLGQSTHADILLALGQPRGNGSVHMSQHPAPRDMLFYEFLKLKGKNVEIEILVVFILDEHYDGHLWFASSERINNKGGFLGVDPKKVVQGYFPATGPLETSFVRGRTSREDLLAVLGTPTGIGAAVLPPQHDNQVVLFYEDIVMDNMQSVAGEIVVDMRQRILLVMLTADVYDGFMWYSNAGVVEGKTQ